MEAPNSQSHGGFRQFGVKFYRYKTLLKKNWWILALAAAIGIAYQGYMVFRQPTLFEASAKLTVREELNTEADRSKFTQNADQFVGTQLAVLKSDEVLVRAHRRLALEVPELAGEQADLNPTVLPRTYIFIVAATGKNPAFLPKFVEAVREEFVGLRQDARSATVHQGLKSLDEMTHTAEGEVAAARTKRDTFQKENNMSFWTEQARQAAQFLADQKTAKGKLETELQRIETLTPDQLLFTHATQSPKPTAPDGPAGAGEGNAVNTDLYSSYIQQTQALAQAKARLKERSTIWKEKHPRLQILKEAVDELQGSVDLILQQNRDATEQRKHALRAELEVLSKSIPEWEKANLDASAKDGELNVLKEEVARTEANLERLRAEARQIAPGADKNDIFVKLGTPTEAHEVSKNVPQHLLAGLMGGLVVGLAVLIFRDRADDRLSSSAEMMNQFSEPILGQIPDVMSSGEGSLLPLLQPEDERYAFAEAFRSLRSSLIFMPNQTTLQTVLVTSAIPNEGKSTITSNLGITMAAAGASIVLVDADLRRGDLASLFDMDGRTGLSNVLRGEVKWKDAVQVTKYPGLTLLPRGPVTNQSSELLLLPSLEKLLEELKEEYDLVLFNTAPILATDDTSSLAPHFDGSLMVIRAQFTGARLTQNALNALYQRQVNVLGLILNCVDTEMPDYYYYRYPKYYAAQ